jgi:hypothetical protein
MENAPRCHGTFLPAARKPTCVLLYVSLLEPHIVTTIIAAPKTRRSRYPEVGDIRFIVS